MKDKQVIEYPCQGETYNDPEYGVYLYGKYERSSVLYGQTKRVFLDSFPTLEEAKAAYPKAKWDGPGVCGHIPVEQVIAHIPDDTDY